LEQAVGLFEMTKMNIMKVFFLSELDSLHSRVVFVGLNRSNAANDSSKVSPFSNFHTKGHTGDKRLKRIIQDANLVNLTGGFMTDISEQIETKSDLISIEEINAVKNFTGKVRSIDESEIRHIICFGDKVFNVFIKGLKISKSRIKEIQGKKIKEVEVRVDNEIWHLYRVWHYSNYGTFIHKSEIELPIQLQYINDKTVTE
jgi:hypothetical protein